MFSFKRKYVRHCIWCNNIHIFNLKVRALKHYHIDSIIENVKICLNVMSMQSRTMINKINKHTMSPISQVTKFDLNMTFFPSFLSSLFAPFPSINLLSLSVTFYPLTLITRTKVLNPVRKVWPLKYGLYNIIWSSSKYMVLHFVA